MTSPGFVASSTRVDAIQEPRGLAVRYAVDDRARQAIEVPVEAMPEDALAFLVACSAVYLGSICLAEEVSVEHRLPAGLLDGLADIAEMLYDIRRWRDDLPLGGPPVLRAAATRAGRPAGEAALDPRAAVALWSGGKDSTLALLTLQANGYRAHPVHATVNAGAEAPERKAVERLAPLLGMTAVERLEVRHDDFAEFAQGYSRAWDAFPLSNRVPFGRDLFLMSLAVPVALREGAACIAVGHDHECRNAVVEYQGKVIPRNDLEVGARRAAARAADAALRASRAAPPAAGGDDPGAAHPARHARRLSRDDGADLVLLLGPQLRAVRQVLALLPR